MPVDTSWCYSIVKNVSGAERHFSFLPNGGRTLANNEEYSFYGDIRQEVGRKAGTEASSARRDRDAFLRAVSGGLLRVVSTPRPIVYDTTLAKSAILRVNNGAVSVIDPYA